MTMGPTTAHGGGPTAERADVANQSVGELVANLSETTTRLLRQEVALAKTETRAEVQTAGRAVGTLAVAGGLALVALIMLSLAAARGLSEYVDLGWAYVIVGACGSWWPGSCTRRGGAPCSEVNPVPERTKDTLIEIPNAVRGR